MRRSGTNRKCERRTLRGEFLPAGADMAEHEPCIGATDDWYTPPDIFDALGMIFDLDPCSPGSAHWVPARKIYTKEDDGLVQPWSGMVFMNPPFGRRNGHVPWLRKFLAHGDGGAWFHQWAVRRKQCASRAARRSSFDRMGRSVKLPDTASFC